MGSPKPAITEDEALEALWQTLQTCDDELDEKIKSATEGKTLGYIDSVSYSPEDCKLTTTYHTLAYDSSTGEFSLNEASARELTHNAPTPRGITKIEEVDNSGEGKVDIQQTFTDGTTETVTIYVPNACGPKGDDGADVSKDFGSYESKPDGSSISYTGGSPGSAVATAEAAGVTCSATALSMSLTGVSLGLKALSMNVGVWDICADGLFCCTYGSKALSHAVENPVELGNNYAITVHTITDAKKALEAPAEVQSEVLENEKSLINNLSRNSIMN